MLTAGEAEAAIDEKLAAARPNGEEAVKLLSFSEMLQPNLATMGLVKGIIDRGALALMRGESGCGKTFFALDLALCVADGRDWFGRKTKRGRVVYVAAEAGASIRNRVAVWARERWSERGVLDFRAVVSPVDLCHIGDKANLKRLAQLVTAVGEADLLIVDTVSRALAGGDENAPADMGAFVTALDRLRARLGCAIVAVHHVGKDSNRGARGHSLLSCAVDTEIAVERRDGGVSVATVTKQRDGMAGAEIAFKLRSVELGADQDGDMVTSCVVEAADYVPAARAKGPTGQAKAALDMLSAVIARDGEPLPFGDLAVYGVKLDHWRVAMARSALFGAGPQFRNAWRRAQGRLADDGHVAFGEGYVWLPEGAVTGDVPF